MLKFSSLLLLTAACLWLLPSPYFLSERGGSFESIDELVILENGRIVKLDATGDSPRFNSVLKILSAVKYENIESARRPYLKIKLVSDGQLQKEFKFSAEEVRGNIRLRTILSLLKFNDAADEIL